MHVEIRKTQDVVVVDMNGKLTAGLGDQILRDTVDALLADRWRKILLNLSDVSFMDSAGVGELVSGLRRARKEGASLKLLNANERVHSTLYIAKLLEDIEKLPGQIVAHIYAPATFGNWPDMKRLEQYENRVLDACAARGLAIEINTRFLYRDHPHDLARHHAAGNGEEIEPEANRHERGAKHHPLTQIANGHIWRECRPPPDRVP